MLVWLLFDANLRQATVIFVGGESSKPWQPERVFLYVADLTVTRDVRLMLVKQRDFTLCRQKVLSHGDTVEFVASEAKPGVANSRVELMANQTTTTTGNGDTLQLEDLLRDLTRPSRM